MLHVLAELGASFPTLDAAVSFTVGLGVHTVALDNIEDAIGDLRDKTFNLCFLWRKPCQQTLTQME